MQRLKPSLLLAAAAVVGTALWASAYVEQTGSRMAQAADRFLESLPKAQAEKAQFAFDSAERLNWHFIPRDRLGLPIKDMTSEQRALAFGLISTGLGGGGYLKVTTIMSLEQVLRDLEQGKGPVRDPERYFLSIFGTPSDRGKWGWRVEGHHLSLNFMLENGKVVAATPTFFGSNPAEVRQGPRQGLRTLADREDTALRLRTGSRRQPAEGCHRLARGPQGNSCRRHSPAADGRGTWNLLRRPERKSTVPVASPGRGVYLRHARRGLQGLA